MKFMSLCVKNIICEFIDINLKIKCFLSSLRKLVIFQVFRLVREPWVRQNLLWLTRDAKWEKYWSSVCLSAETSLKNFPCQNRNTISEVRLEWAWNRGTGMYSEREHSIFSDILSKCNLIFKMENYYFQNFRNQF